MPELSQIYGDYISNQRNIYEEYKNDLLKMRNSDLYYAKARLRGKQLSPAFQKLLEEYKYRMRREGAPESAYQSFALKKGLTWTQLMDRIQAEAEARDIERRDALNQQLKEAELKSKSKFAEMEYNKKVMEYNEKEQKKAEEDAKKRMWWQVGGTVLGGAVGSLIPGVGTMIGAKIGSGLGEMASSGVGHYSEQAFATGFADVIGGFADVAQYKSERDFADLWAKNRDAILSIKDPKKLDRILSELAVGGTDFRLKSKILQSILDEYGLGQTKKYQEPYVPSMFDPYPKNPLPSNYYD